MDVSLVTVETNEGGGNLTFERIGRNSELAGVKHVGSWRRKRMHVVGVVWGNSAKRE